MNVLMDLLRDILVVATVSIAVVGSGMIVLFLAVRKSLSRETYVEVSTMIEDSVRYAMWNLQWFFGGSEKKVVGWSVGLVVTAALLAVTTQQLNTGTWTLPWVLGCSILFLVIAVFAYCLYQENKKSLHQRY